MQSFLNFRTLRLFVCVQLIFFLLAFCFHSRLIRPNLFIIPNSHWHLLFLLFLAFGALYECRTMRSESLERIFNDFDYLKNVCHASGSTRIKRNESQAFASKQVSVQFQLNDEHSTNGGPLNRFDYIMHMLDVSTFTS